MGYDNLLTKAGDFGPYQLLLSSIFVCYTTFLCGLNYYTQEFIFTTPAHRCSDEVIDSEQGRVGASWDDVLPWVPREREGKPSKCQMINSDGFEAKFKNLSSVHMSSLKLQDSDPDLFSAIRHDVISMVEMSPKKTCGQGWNYDHSTVFTTITSENNWVCDDDYKPMVVKNIFWIGNIIGCIAWGFTNDYFGRKPTVLLTHGLYFLAGAATLFAPNFGFLIFCSGGVLWGLKANRAPAHDDGQLQPGLPLHPLGGHALALLEASSSYRLLGSSSCPLLLEVNS